MTIAFQNGSFTGGNVTANTSLTSGGVTSASLYNTDYLDQKYEYQDTRESYELAYSGRDAAIETKISNISTYLAEGKEDKALAAYNELLEEMNAQTRYAQLVGEDGDDTQLRAVARQLIEAELGGSLEEFIRANAKDNAAVENQQIRSWGNCDSTSQEDLLKEMCNIDEEEGHSNIFTKALNVIASPFRVAWNELFNGGKKM